MVEHRHRSPWARPTGGESAGGESAGGAESVVGAGAAESLATWRARAAATADPRWARPPSGTVGAEQANGSAWSAAGPTEWSRSGEGRGGSIGTPWAPATVEPVARDPSVDPTGRGVGPWREERTAASPLRRGLAVVCPPLVVLAGGAAVIGSTMTWATVHAFGFVEFAIRGTDPDQHGQLTMVLGILAMIAGLLLAGRRVDWGRMLAAVAGLMLILTAVVDLIRFRRGGPLVGTGFDATTDVGPGLWVIIGSGALLLLTGALVRFTPLARSPRSAAPNTQNTRNTQK